MKASERLIKDFEKYYQSLPYKWATKEALFHDWLYTALLERYRGEE